MHFSIKKEQIPYLIELNNPHLNEVILYEKNSTGFLEVGSGGDFKKTFFERTYLNRRFIFPLAPGSNIVDYYLYINNKNSSTSFPLWLWTQKKFEKRESKINVFYGFYFGVLFFVSFLSIITSLVIRKKVFFYYGMYVFFLSLYLFTYLGFSFQYLYPNLKFVNNYTRFPIIVFFVIFLILFIESFLNIKENIPRLSKLYHFVIVFFLLNFLSWIIFTNFYVSEAQFLLDMLYFFIIIVIFSSLYAAYKQLKYNRINGIIFLIAFVFLFIGIFLLILIQYGFVNESIFFINPVILGSGFEILTLSTAMMILLKKIIVSRQIIEQKANKLELEKKELSFQKLELEKKLEKNKKISIQLRSRVVLNVEKILYIKSDGHYVEFYLETKEKPEIDRNTMKGVLEMVSKNLFVQIHKSYIVNINRIKIINSNQLMLDNGDWIPLSRTYKHKLKDRLNKK